MTVSLYPDERKAVYWVFTPPPDGQPEFEVDGVWHPITLTGPVNAAGGRKGVALICGAEMDPVPAGHVVITRDTLARVRADGEIHTADYFRIRR